MLNKIQQKKLLKASADVVTQFLRKYSKAGQQIHLLGKSMLFSTNLSWYTFVKFYLILIYNFSIMIFIKSLILL